MSDYLTAKHGDDPGLVAGSNDVRLSEPIHIDAPTFRGTIPAGTAISIETRWPSGLLDQEAEITIRFRAPAAVKYFDES